MAKAGDQLVFRKVFVHVITPKAILASMNAVKDDGAWFPLSQLEIDEMERETWSTIGIPGWLVKKHPKFAELTS